MKLLKILVAAGLLWFVFFGSLPKINIPIVPPDEVDEVEEIIQIEKPSEDIVALVSPIAKRVTETEDRAKLALFNYEFANRITNYSTDGQQVNDLYTKAGELFFDTSLKGKYEGYATGLKSLIQSVTTDDNHILSTDEKQRLKDLFNGLAWALVER